MKAVANAIYSFSTKGQFHNEKDKYICEGLLDMIRDKSFLTLV